MGFLAVTFVRVAVMERSLIWVGGDAKGWACSKCRWKFPVPTLLTGEEAKGAYDRLAAGNQNGTPPMLSQSVLGCS